MKLILIISFLFVFGLNASELFDAIKASDVAKVRKLIDSGANVNESIKINGKELLPLNESIKVGNIEIVKLMLEAKANMNVSDSEGNFPLLDTLHNDNGKLEIVKLLIDSGADVNIATKEGYTALMGYSLAKGSNCKPYSKIVKLLLERKANVDAFSLDRDFKVSSLIIAVEVQCLPIIKLLINAKANVNETFKDGYTLLMLANLEPETEKSIEIVKLLIKSGADVNAIANDFSTALEVAKIKNNRRMLKILQSAGAKN